MCLAMSMGLHRRDLRTQRKRRDCKQFYICRVKITNLLLLIWFIANSSFSLAQVEEEIESEIEIKAIAGLKYDVTRFKVKPGERIKLILTNVDDMDHNLVI